MLNSNRGIARILESDPV